VHVAEAPVARRGAYLICGLLAPAGVPIGLPPIPMFVLAGVALVPHRPVLELVDNQTPEPRRARVAGARRRRGLRWEGTCRSPT